MQITLGTTFNLLILLTILVLILQASLFKAKLVPNLKPCLRRRRRSEQSQPQPKNHPKPGWVKAEVLRLLALMSGAGVRTIANTFNAKFASRGESVSKTYVAQLKKKKRYEWMRLRKEFRKPPKPQRPNQTWALDFTDVNVCGDTNVLIGVIDHGSRKSLALRFTDKSAAAVLGLIQNLIATFGKPKAIRTDNDGAFVSEQFKQGMAKLEIRHQRSDPHKPWKNGRIERFFGTFKSAIRHVQIDSTAMLQQAMDEFCFYYNHIRPHQNIGNRTPEMAWLGKTRYPRTEELHWFEAWEGVLCGWLHMPKTKRLKRLSG